MRHHKLFWGSSYDRGIQHLLKMWPTIKEKYPEATLDIAYGWELFIRGYANNPERMEWMASINELMKQPGITHHGRIGKEKLHQIRLQCGIWAYTTDFFEINCITALDAQKDGLVPVTINYGALKETVQSGTKVDGDIYDKETQDAYLQALFSYMADPVLWESESRKAQEFAKNYSWDITARKWADTFK